MKSKKTNDDKLFNYDWNFQTDFSDEWAAEYKRRTGVDVEYEITLGILMQLPLSDIEVKVLTRWDLLPEGHSIDLGFNC